MTDDPVRLRRGGLADAEAVGRVWALAGDARRAALGLPPTGDAHASADSAAARLEQDGTTLVVAEDGVDGGGRAVVGMALVLPARADDGESEELVPGLLHVSSVAVAPSHWRRGIGHRLMLEVAGVVDAEGWRQAQLWVVDSNDAAKALYRRHGYAPSGRTKTDPNGENIEHWATATG